jgi:hypothetical protein
MQRFLEEELAVPVAALEDGSRNTPPARTPS